MVFTYSNYNNKIRNAVLIDNSSNAKQWAYLTDARLNAIYEHIYDNCVYLYKNTETRSGSEMMDVIVNKDVADQMAYSLISSEDADCFFIYDSDTGMLIFSGSNDTTNVTQVQLKENVRRICPEIETSGLNNRNWNIVTILGHGYFYKSVRLGKYICGALSACDKYDINDSLYLPNSDISSFFVNDNTITCAGGNKDLSEIIDLEGEEDYFKDDYAVSLIPYQTINGGIVLISQTPSPLKSDYLQQSILVAFAVLCFVLMLTLIIYINRKIKKPGARLMEANSKVASGDFEYRLNVDEAGSEEFENLFNSFNEMTDQISKLKIEQYDMQIKEETNKLVMLRAQVRPHTFLNALTTVNNMTYDKSPEEIRKYINKFAKFTRYMLQTYSEYTTIKEELGHIENYIDIQRIRTDKDIVLTINCPEILEEEKMPFLMLYTLVENSLKHNIVEGNEIRITVSIRQHSDDSFEGISMIEEDNGNGFSKESLEKLEATDEMFTKEHLGLTNVRYTLNLMFRRNDLMHISNKEDGGARVEILIPKGDTHENTGM